MAVPEYGPGRWWLFTFPLLLVFSGCAGIRSAELPPDERYGHRYTEETSSIRRTISITEADSSRDFFLYPIVTDSVHVRPAPFREGIAQELQTVPVEVLVKGSFPDACSELHELNQVRFGHLIEVEILMRRPRGISCSAMIRPYRYYFMLEGEYRPGAYTLKINDEVYPFVITASQD